MRHQIIWEKKKNFLNNFINHQENNSEINFYVLGHRHLPMEIDINKSCRYINTGDWLDHYSFAVFEKENISLKYY